MCAAMTAWNDNPELRTILEPAYQPCVHLISGVCKDHCAWQPDRGLVPRGFGGAVATADMVRLVLVTSEPGDPGDDERYAGSAGDMMSKAMDYRVKYLRTRGSLRRNGRGGEPYTQNLRAILDLCWWPELDIDRQLERTWLTNSVKCSESGGRHGSAIGKVCVETYLKKELALFPHAFVIALGGKAEYRLQRSGVRCGRTAMHPSARSSTRQKEESWRAAALAFHRWLKDADLNEVAAEVGTVPQDAQLQNDGATPEQAPLVSDEIELVARNSGRVPAANDTPAARAPRGALTPTATLSLVGTGCPPQRRNSARYNAWLNSNAPAPVSAALAAGIPRHHLRWVVKNGWVTVSPA
jgi:hypothetical protein